MGCVVGENAVLSCSLMRVSIWSHADDDAAEYHRSCGPSVLPLTDHLPVHAFVLVAAGVLARAGSWNITYNTIAAHLSSQRDTFFKRTTRPTSEIQETRTRLSPALHPPHVELDTVSICSEPLSLLGLRPPRLGHCCWGFGARPRGPEDAVYTFAATRQ